MCFKKSDEVCQEFVAEARSEIKETLDFVLLDEILKRKLLKDVQSAIGKNLVEQQIPEAKCRRILEKLVKKEVEGFSLTQSQVNVLRKIGEKGSARSSQYKDFGRKSGQDFLSNYLSKMYSMGLLTRVQQGTAVSYSLRGSVALASEYNIL